MLLAFECYIKGRGLTIEQKEIFPPIHAIVGVSVVGSARFAIFGSPLRTSLIIARNIIAISRHFVSQTRETFPKTRLPGNKTIGKGIAFG